MAKKRACDQEGLDGYDWYEGQTKWPVTRIVEVSFGVISVIVWILILFRIFSSQNGDFEKMILLDERAAALYPEETSQVLRIFSSTDQEGDGSVLVYYPIYLSQTQNLQLTARINHRSLPGASVEPGYLFLIRESGSEGVQYHPLSYYAKEKKFQYTFYRLCFDNVSFQKDHVYTLLVFPGDYTALSGENPYPASQAHFSFVIYNFDTYSQEITPPKDVFQIQ